MPATPDLEDEVDLVDDEPAEARPGVGDQWRAMPRYQRWLSVGAVGIVLFLLLRSCGGDDEAPAAGPTTTTASTLPQDPWQGLPTPAPLVAATIRPEDVGQFINQVRTDIADGTSICDVFFGFTTFERTDGQGTEVRWVITTPAMQARSGVGVALPSSKYPTRAFYGPPCNVPQRDVPLAIPSTTTTTKAG